MSQFPFRDEDFVLNTKTNRFLGFFQTFYKQDESKSNSQTKIQETASSSNYFQKFKGQVKYSQKVQEKTNQTLSSLKNKTEEAQNVAVNWKYITLFILLGIISLFLSFLFLPFIILKPQKFIGFFTLSSVFFLLALVFLKGIGQFLKEIFQKEKIIFVFAYFGTMAGTIYYSLINPSYIYVIILAIFQIFALILLITSSLKGRDKVLKFVFSKMFSFVKRIFLRMIGQKPSLLPF